MALVLLGQSYLVISLSLVQVGAIWERLVQITKRCLRKVLGRSTVSYEELQTILADVDVVMNSRPLCYSYEDSTEEVITPSHLMYGRRILRKMPEQPRILELGPETLTRRATHLQMFVDRYWRRWSREYLVGLHEFHNNRLNTNSH